MFFKYSIGLLSVGHREKGLHIMNSIHIRDSIEEELHVINSGLMGEAGRNIIRLGRCLLPWGILRGLEHRIFNLFTFHIT